MLKAVENLVLSTDKRIGNHRVTTEEVLGDIYRNYWYHDTVICNANVSKKTFSVDNGGWGTQSTQRAINDYRSYYQGLGYIEEFDTLEKMCDYFVCMPYNKAVVVAYKKAHEPHDVVFSKEMYRKYDKTFNDKVATFRIRTPDHSEMETFEFKGPKSLEDKLKELFRFYLDENFS